MINIGILDEQQEMEIFVSTFLNTLYLSFVVVRSSQSF